jgi:uncharacterized protein YcnI
MRAFVLAVVALLAMPATALAHVELDPARVAPGSFTLFTILSPDEATVPLTGLRITIPAGMTVDSAAGTPGFTTRIVRDQTHRIAVLSWQGGHVAPGDLALFRFSAAVSGGGTLRPVAVQTFADGSSRVWHTPTVEVAGTAGGGSDTVARGIAVVALAVAAAAVALALRRRAS